MEMIDEVEVEGAKVLKSRRTIHPPSPTQPRARWPHPTKPPHIWVQKIQFLPVSAIMLERIRLDGAISATTKKVNAASLTNTFKSTVLLLHPRGATFLEADESLHGRSSAVRP